ncbi:MAG TPA: YdcF family protein [Bryobacteraceae bacterium]|nr:YdcF family protein [Bryobacteraceae bacterium]
MARPRTLGINLAILAAAVVILALTHSLWMGWMGAFLVDADSPVRADLVVVLAGDPYGNRILKGAELVKQGYASRVLVSGPAGFYGLHESDLAIPFAVKHGFPATWFVAFPHEAHSTDEEARVILPELRKRNAHRVLVVTSDFHTRRALHILHARWPDIELHMVAAPDEFFSAYGWWHTREGRKTFFLECSKTLASMVGM